jgi:hypothetical protein
MSVILKALRLMKKKMASTELEFNKILTEITQELSWPLLKTQFYPLELLVRKLSNTLMLGPRKPSLRQGRQKQREKTGERLMRKLIFSEDLMQNEGEEPGGDRCADLTTGSETGPRHDIPSIVIYLE